MMIFSIRFGIAILFVSRDGKRADIREGRIDIEGL